VVKRWSGPLCAVAVALAVPGVASGHVVLESASPSTQSSVATPPTEVRLRFSQPVTVASRAIQLFAPDGTILSGTSKAVGGGIVVAPVSRLVRGSAYTVRWRVVGQDGHAPAGVYTFGVGVAAPPPTEAVGAGGITWKDHLARWGLFAALALLIGPLALRLLVLPGPLPGPLERRFHLITTIAAFAVINVGIAAFVLRAANALQLPLADLVYGDLQPFAEQTRFGVAFLVMTLGFGVVATLLLFAWVSDLTAPRWAAFALAVLLASGISLAGHQATEPNANWASGLADWLHLVSASVWVGGLVAIAFLVWPAAPSLRRRAFLGFSRLAVGLVAVMVLAGAYLALVRLGRIADLWETAYGQVLLAKLAIVSLALGWGGFHHLVVRPRLEAGEQPRARPSLIGETAVALAVLLAAAVLTNAAPPPAEPGSNIAVRSDR
jgi:copper transport protein